MKKFYFIIYLGFCFGIAYGQVQNSAQCGTKTPPLSWENWFSSRVQEYKIRATNRTEVVNYTIPVIVHILHDGDAIGQNENISWAQVNSQIEILNADFAGNNSDIINVPTVFQPAKAGNTGIQFCLAKTDPDGNVLAEEGVDRINWETREWLDPYSFYNYSYFSNYCNAVIKPLSIWDPKKYLNVWLLRTNSIIYFGGFSSIPAGSGYGDLGSDVETNFTSGIVINQSRWGNTGTAADPPFNKGRIASHEFGHFFGLWHISGDQSCGNDYCDDTPPQLGGNSVFLHTPPSGLNFGCPTHPFQVNSCNANPSGEMFMNYMDYTYDECKFMFTKDQAIRMQTTMENGTFRNPLNNSTACLSCPELVIINPSASAFNVENNVTISFVERNKGLANAAPNNVNFHLSLDSVLTPGLNGDVFLDFSPVTQTLIPNSQTNIISKVLTIPPSVTPGVYYVFLAADGTGVVNECVEDNNFATIVISISSPSSPTQASYRYWFDNNFSNAINANVISGNNLYDLQGQISTSFLTNGLHSINFQFKDDGNKWSSVANNIFYKLSSHTPAGSAKYEYWFDNLFSFRTVTSISNSSSLIVLNSFSESNLSNGLHTFNIRFKPDGKHWSSVVSSFFFKSDSAIATGPTQYEYWFDSNTSEISVANISSTSNLFLLNNTLTTGLVNGLHTFNIRFRPDGKKWSSIASSLFYKDDSSNIAINNLAQFIYWYDNNWQAPKTISIVGADNLSWTLNTDVSELSEGIHKLSMSFKDIKGKWSSIVSDNFTRSPIPTQNCFFGNRKFGSGFLTGGLSSYQWQLDDGTGFTNISDNSFYSGTNSDSLNLINVPSSWYGYKYRCLVTTGGNTITGEDRILKFSMIWTGAVNTAWEDPGNWSCGVVPDANTDVYINSSMPVYPKVNSLVSCRSINLQPGTALEVMQGFSINITGRE